MQITPLDEQNLPLALAYLRRSPYRNAMLLSNVSQLRSRCDVLVAQRKGRVAGIASTYYDLPTPNFIFTAQSDMLAGDLIMALADRNPRLRTGEVMALLPETSFRQISRTAAPLGYEVEYQMGVEPETLKVPPGPPARRLSRADLPAMSALAEAAGLRVWHENALELGPAFGCFEGERLVAMAATHFATPEIIELGHVGTHPEARGRGYAKACTAALTQAAFALAPRVFLMVLEDNMPARAAYKALGFYAIERFYLSRFQL